MPTGRSEFPFQDANVHNSRVFGRRCPAFGASNSSGGGKPTSSVLKPPWAVRCPCLPLFASAEFWVSECAVIATERAEPAEPKWLNLPSFEVSEGGVEVGWHITSRAVTRRNSGS